MKNIKKKYVVVIDDTADILSEHDSIEDAKLEIIKQEKEDAINGVLDIDYYAIYELDQDGMINFECKK